VPADIAGSSEYVKWSYEQLKLLNKDERYRGCLAIAAFGVWCESCDRIAISVLHAIVQSRPGMDPIHSFHSKFAGVRRNDSVAWKCIPPITTYAMANK
jgi:hypothetical protein